MLAPMPRRRRRGFRWVKVADGALFDWGLKVGNAKCLIVTVGEQLL
jgi:hypothetical protein